MAEDTNPQGGTGATPATSQTQETTHQETDWKAEARKWESRAKENLTAAKANEDAAKRLADIEESQKTEAQKQADKINDLEAQLRESSAAQIVAEVAAEKGVPRELLHSGTREEVEAAADKLLKFRDEKAAEQGGRSFIGQRPQNQEGMGRDFVRQLFHQND